MTERVFGQVGSFESNFGGESTSRVSKLISEIRE